MLRKQEVVPLAPGRPVLVSDHSAPSTKRKLERLASTFISCRFASALPVYSHLSDLSWQLFSIRRPFDDNQACSNLFLNQQSPYFPQNFTKTTGTLQNPVEWIQATVALFSACRLFFPFLFLYVVVTSFGVRNAVEKRLVVSARQETLKTRKHKTFAKPQFIWGNRIFCFSFFLCACVFFWCDTTPLFCNFFLFFFLCVFSCAVWVFCFFFSFFFFVSFFFGTFAKHSCFSVLNLTFF